MCQSKVPRTATQGKLQYVSTFQVTTSNDLVQWPKQTTAKTRVTVGMTTQGRRQKQA